MKKLKYILIVSLITSYSCNSNTKTLNDVIDSNKKTEIATHSNPIAKDPSKKDIILALERVIDFCKTADREEFRKYLNASEAQINSVSDEEFIEIKEDNAYLYKNIQKSLKNDEASFEILSNENAVFEISFTEKESDSLVIVMNFSYDKDSVLILHSLNTL